MAEKREWMFDELIGQKCTWRMDDDEEFVSKPFEDKTVDISCEILGFTAETEEPWGRLHICVQIKILDHRDLFDSDDILDLAIAGVALESICDLPYTYF